MKRRSFLKGLLGIGVGAIAVPVIVSPTVEKNKDLPNNNFDTIINGDLKVNGIVTYTGNGKSQTIITNMA